VCFRKFTLTVGWKTLREERGQGGPASSRWENNNKINLKKIVYKGSALDMLAQDIVKCSGIVNIVM
jgi:hypothetical protein